MKTYFRWIVCWVAILAITVPMELYAACEIIDTTPDGGYIITCDGPDTIGIISSDFSDIITINAGVPVSKTDMQSADVTATATATTVDAGGGNNQVTNNGSIGAAADANALPEDGSASQATSTATAIKAGNDPDVIQNFSTITSTATSNSESGAISLTLEGNTQFQGTTTSTATATGIDAGGGNNQVINQVINPGAIATIATSEAEASSINVNMGDSGGADVRTIANAIAAGISGSNGEDEIITRGGTITVNAAANVNNTNALVTIDAANESLVVGSSLSDASVTAEAVATGITGSAGDDTIVNGETEITADANSDATTVGVSLTISGRLEGNSEGKALSDSSATANAAATGIDGGGGNDSIENRGKIFANADSTVTAVEVGVNIEITKEGNASGAALSNTSVTANAVAKGIDSGSESDEINNRGDIGLLSKSSAKGVSVALDVAGTMKGSAAGNSVSDASVTAKSTALGINGGDGNDTITNEGSITLMKQGVGVDPTDAKATAVSVGLTVAGSLEGNADGKALSNSSALAEATATGINGGAGDDTITNRGAITASVDSSATAVGVSVGITLSKDGNATGSALSDAKVTAQSTAAGIDGDEGNDRIDNRGDINLTSNATATGVSVALDVAGGMKGESKGEAQSDSSTTAQSTAIGIKGGDGDDTIINDASATTTNANASATGVSVGLTVSGSMKGNAEGKALSDASVTANASAIGIDGGSGQDTIDNWSKLSSEVDASATGVAASLKVGFTKEGDVSPNAVTEGSSLSNTSVTAQSTATGIDGGEGDDTINNRGDIELLSKSSATGVSMALDVAGTMKGNATGSSASDASVTAKSTAIGINGGGGNDTVINEGSITLMKQAEGIDPTDAKATAVSVGLTVSGSLEGNADGKALSNSSALADAAATGINGGGGNDTITNRGAITASINSSATAVGVGLDVNLSLKEGGNATGSALSDAKVTAQSTATGIDGGGGNDTIHNRGDVNLLANSTATGVSVALDVAGSMKGESKGEAQSDSGTTAQSTVIAIAGGSGDDTITNDGPATTTNATASATGVSVGLTVSGSMKGNAEGKALSDASVKADASAIGIDAGSGQDTIDNWSNLSSEVDASATGVAASLKVGFTKEGDVSPNAVAEGSSLSNASVTANASATGIDGGEGDDRIDNRGEIALLTKSSATGVSVALDVAGTMKGNAAGSSASDSSVTAQSAAIGINGGEGNDTIINDGAITLMKQAEGIDPTDAKATAVSVGLTVSGSLEGNADGKALSNSSALADAKAIGINGGAGNDTITNRGAITANVNSSATAAGVSVGITLSKEGNATGSALSDAKVTAQSTATGIDGGEGNDTIDNRGNIDLTSNATATGVSVALDVAGSMKGDSKGEAQSDSSTKAQSTAIGITGGSGDDTITNDGLTTITNANANATGVSVGLTVSGSLKGNAEGKALSDAKVTATASATGIDAGSGQDTIENWSKLSSDVDASATGVAASLKVGFTKEGDVSPNAIAEGSALSNTSVTANASATGIDGGEDNDTINNRGDIDLLAKSSATGVSVAIDVAGTMKGNTAGSSASNASVTAQSTAIGINGGEGNDTITNEGSITLMKQAEGIDPTDASATAVSVGLTVSGSMEGNAEGKALSNSSALADATATGISGGAGIDAITNSGAITASVGSTATAVGVGVDVALSKEGKATGAALSDASVTANAAATGIDGGEGDDTIKNRGDIDLLVNADATGVAVSVAVSGSMKGNVEGKAQSDASVTANAAATGIDGGGGADTIENWSKLSSGVDATATGVSVSLKVGLSKEGDVVSPDALVEGSSLSNTSVTANAAAKGIDSGSESDEINNYGDIDVLANAAATGVSVAVDVAGTMKGSAGGSSVSDARVTASATATGINGGAGNDTIINQGSITLMKQAEGIDQTDAKALGVAVSLDITGSMKGTAEGQALSKATTTAEAAATGISGGSGADDITNTAAITADVDSDAKGVAVAANVSVSGNGVAEGGSLSDVSTVAKAEATGIDGGEEGDTIDNSGEVQLFSNADATSTAVSATISGTMRGQAGGEALSKATTTADATATGIAGGDGADKITNRGMIFANVESDANAAAVAANISITGQGIAEGAALSDSSSTASARATGIDGGAGDDIIDNKGAINLSSFSDAQATAVSVGLAGSMRGMAEGKSVADSSAKAMAQSIGIDGGEGNDIISSSANPITTFAQSLSDAESVSVQGTGAVGMAKGAAVADSSASSLSYSTGIDGGLGNDTIENASEIKSTARADAKATSTTVGVTIGLGAADTVGTGNSSATAKANSTGIEGGDGNDRITNAAKITTGGLENLGPMANAQAGATTVTVGLAAGLNMGKASSNASALAEANAAGISSGSGDDWIYNTGDITVGPDPTGTGSMAIGSAKSTTVKVDVTLGASLGGSTSDTSSTAVVNLAGIKSGSGDDWVYNTGAITVGADPYDPAKPDAMAKAKAASETVDVGITIGGSFSDASSNASATAVSTVKGIETDQGNDWISNSGPIKVFSSSEAVGLAQTTKVSLTLGVSEGGAKSDASSLSRALATGIDSGGDADEISTDSELIVKARSKGTAISTAKDYNILSVGAALQSAQANSSSTAEAIARGIDGGTGGDTITAKGTISITADSFVESRSRSSTVTGLGLGLNVQEAQSRAETIANSLAVGIDGSEGNDTINSTAAITLNASSSASTQAISATNTGFNIAGASSGESVAGAATNVTATGIGIRGGPSELAIGQTDADVIINEGPISVTTTVSATTESTSTAESTTFIGAATGKAVSDASARVLAEGIGIDGGADNDAITNKNTLTVKTKADSSVKSTSNVDSDVTFGGASSKGVSNASANVSAEATGMAGGSGDDVITSLAPVTVEAESIGSVTAKSYVNAAVTFGGASSKAASDASATKKGIAKGIDGGDGNDVITNYDTLNVSAISAGAVTSESTAKAKATFGSTSSLTTTAAALEGSVEAAGIIGGSGNDTIKNLGLVDSMADATLQVNNSSMSTAKSTFGSSNARAYSVSTLQGKASSLGVSGDGGDDLIENDGVVDVSAIANTTVNSSTVAIAKSFWGSEYTEAASSNYAAGESTAAGITAGVGKDSIVNKGLVTVEAGSGVTVNSLTVSSDGPASSDAGTLALAYGKGIDSGAGNDNILNTDTVFVKTEPRITSATRTFAGGNVDGKVGIVLNAAATGITGGGGNDQIRNDGNVLVFAGSPKRESTVSENALSGSATITDKSFPTSTDPKALVGKWIRITGGESPDFFTQVVAFDIQTGTFTLSDPLKYDLPADATYVLYDYGDKVPDITSLNVTVGGRTRVDASTTASVQAKGIVGGDGDDDIVNAGTTAVSASNFVKTVELNVTRNIRADTRIESNVNAVGIEGNDQSSVTDVSDGGKNVFTDLSRKGEDPEAIVGKRALFKSGSSTDFSTLVTAFDPDTGTFTLADPLPSGGLMRGDIYTLGGGSDSISNLGAIDVRADSTIDASSWSLSFRGADIEVKGQAQALSIGMRGGEFDDSFQNLGPIVTRSTAGISSTERVKVKFGEGAEQKLSFEASSNSVGVDAGAGNDQLTNAKSGSIGAEAISIANVDGGVTTTYGVYWLPTGETKTINLADAIAQSTAVGIDLGAGHNIMSSEGELKVSANAVVTAKAISDLDLWGETDADADAIAKASAWGIKAGGGEDQVLNRNLIQVDASADATSVAQGSKVGSKDDTSAVTENSSKGSNIFVDASLISAEGQAAPDLVGKWVRFLTGGNENFFTRIVGFDPSTGTITVLDELPADLKAAVLDDNGNVITPADAYTFSAARNGTSASAASALATGIDAGDGNAIVENTGVIRVKASAKADTTAQTFGGQATAQANSTAEARGIRTGTGDDVIRNAGIVDVKSEVVATTSGASPTEIATATGIDAGDGNNTIVNEGQINVTASVAQPNGEATATGIITGDGDDTIVNGGTISATTVRNSISSLGVGINSGAGNDQIFLMNGSETNGHIDLGEGDDWLTLTGTALVTGDVTGAAGIDTIVFDGAGSVSFTPMAFENAIKQGAGTYSVASLPTMQRIEIKEGTLEVNDNYSFSNSGFFETFVKGDGSFGQFKVNGTTELAGDLNVLKGPGPYINGTTYDIIEANAVNSAFSNVMLPAPNNFVSFRMNQSPTFVQIEAYVKPFTWLARNRVQWAVANYLDRILPSSTGDLWWTLGQIQNLSQSEYSTALSTLSSDSYDIYTRTTYSTAQQYTKSLQYRMNHIRSYQYAHLSHDEKPILLAFRGSDASLSQLFSPGGPSQIQGRNGLWFDAFGQWGEQDQESRYRWDGGYVGYDYFLRGATLGFDHNLTDQFMAGVSIGYSRSDIDLDDDQGSGYIKSLYGSIYGSYFYENLYIDGILSYGKNWYDNRRLITIGTEQRKVYSKHDGDLFSAYLQGGYYFDIKKWLIGPFTSLQYIYLDEEDFKEKGAGSVSLRIDGRQTDSFISELGLRLTRVFKVKYGSLIPELNAAWLHDFDIDDRVIRSSFAGSPGATFSIKGQDVERNGASLGAGITFVHKSGLSTSLKYRGEFRDKYKSNGVMGEVRFTF